MAINAYDIFLWKSLYGQIDPTLSLYTVELDLKAGSLTLAKIAINQSLLHLI